MFQRTTVDNNGIGALYATFYIKQLNDEYVLTENDIGKAVTLFANNTISFSNHLYPTLDQQLLGRLEHVSGNLSTVQIKGIARYPIDPNINVASPKIGFPVGCCKDGTVVFCRDGKGTVIAIDYDNNTCDVLL